MSRRPLTRLDARPRVEAQTETTLQPVLRGLLATVPAAELESQLRLRLAGLTEEAPETSLEDSNEDLSELFDCEDWADDEDGDGTVDPEDLLPPWEAEGSTGPRQNSPRVDVHVKRLDGLLFLTSGVADLLPLLSGGSALVHQVHVLLRQRIAHSLQLVRAVVEANQAYFLSQQEEPERLAGHDLQRLAGIDEQRLSYLKNCLTLQTPWGAVVPLRDFVHDRSVQPESEKAVLRLFLETLDEEIESGACSDQDWLEMLQGRVGTKQAVGQVRKRLGIPDSRKRKAIYQQQREIIQVLVEGLDPQQKALQTRVLRDLLSDLKNPIDRTRAEAWLQRLEK